MAVSKASIAKYILLPGYLPRFKELFSSGFMHIAYLMAIIYQSIRLLPNGHPYLNPANIGRYGIRHVMAEAANHLVFSRKNIDQIIVFFMLLTGVVLLAVQFILLIVSFMTQPAMAQAFIPWLSTPSANMPYGPAQDIAFMTLDRVFGMEGIFNSCISRGTPCENLQGVAAGQILQYPFPMHIALRKLLSFYSYGISIVATIIILYFVVALVTETAMTGTPFGQRANKAWMPIRLIMFFALLAPLNLSGGRNEGINGAQYITFMAAKWGSNFASNGWGVFNATISGSYLGNVNTLIATPNIPELNNLVQFFFLAQMCRIGENTAHQNNVQPYLVKGSIIGSNREAMMSKNFTQAREFFENGTLVIRFGTFDAAKYGTETGFVKPHCGELTMTITDASEPGSLGIMEDYYTLLQSLWADPEIIARANCTLNRIAPVGNNPNCSDVPDADFAKSIIENYNLYVANAVAARVNQQVANGNWLVPPELLEKGWAGAAIWYNRIAQMNGAVTTAVFNLPQPRLYPYVMEEIAKQHMKEDKNATAMDRYNPFLADNRQATLPRGAADLPLASALYNGFKFWQMDGVGATRERSESTGNKALDTINWIFGTSGLFSMRKNADVHPLAQLSSLGKSLIEATIRNALIGFVGNIAANFVDKTFQPLVEGGSKLFLATVQVTLVLGVMLYFVLPLLPFVYFLFGVSGWIKSIFEAIVAMPLWALAHISRIDGEGLPGPAASNGYFLLFEIFLRPILIVIGMIASITIFSALVLVMNEVFDLVVNNATGFDVRDQVDGFGGSLVKEIRGPLDELFYTVVYVCLVYMIGTGCFKMIDQVPNNILRWMGVSVATFQEGAGDPAGQLSSSIYRGTTVTVGQIAGGTSEISGGKLSALLGGGGSPPPPPPR